MIKKLSTVCLGIVALFLSLMIIPTFEPVLGAPSADVSMAITSAVADGDDIIVTVDISISKPSEAYASLDFNLVSSSHDNLTIANGSGSSLAISFIADYGSAYHPGKEVDGGGYSWLIGIFSQESGNHISGATAICSIRLRYSGTTPQTLSLRDAKLIYVDEAGDISTAALNTDSDKLSIDRSLVDTQPADTEPTGTDTTPTSPTGSTDSTHPTPPVTTGGGISSFVLWMIYTVLVVAAVIGVFALAVFTRKKKH